MLALHRYFNPEEFHSLHPEAEGATYHDSRHSLRAARIAYDFALGRGLRSAEARFIWEVALLHDVDPEREPGTPARVPNTLERLREDFARERSLTGVKNGSALRDRFGWSAREWRMAEAMIQRTEFPFSPAHSSPAYADEPPPVRYAAMLEGLTPEDRRFVLREAALLSEFADKCSWYATEDPPGAQRVAEGLVNEINAAAGNPVMTREGLRTDCFLNSIGLRESFEVDLELAAEMEFDLELPSRSEAFACMPDHYGRAFETNLTAFQDESAGR
jgi:hypothetical protein